jgi:hypothetical protein
MCRQEPIGFSIDTPERRHRSSAGADEREILGMNKRLHIFSDSEPDTETGNLDNLNCGNDDAMR